MISVQSDPIDAAALLAELSASPKAGAVASFVGMVRNESDGEAVVSLDLDHHPVLTAKVVSQIAEDARARFELIDLVIVHRHGTLHPGEPIVFVGAAAAHRRTAFEAVDCVMDRLKTEAPFWKRERTGEGARWIEARASDHADRRRWEEPA